MTYQATIQALADPTRLAIFERLAREPSAVGALAAELPVSRPAVSQHLAVLRKARLVREERQGTRRIYHVELEGLSELRRYLDRFWDEVMMSFKAEADRLGGGRDEEEKT
jgi:DNA-binding transcriptional ArsR family regulator